ncbi:MAG: hypothetical protein HQM00_05550 [Magnetococcales bacterium]|nr:hypothetical protein [Magnetococcales bacterium]
MEEYNNTGNENRSLDLCVTFIDGFAVGYSFAVKEELKSAFDIHLTDYQEPVFDDNGDRIIEERINVKGVKYKHKATKTKTGWTQGIEYNFSEGDMIHSNVIAYTNWSEFIKQENSISLQVILSKKSTKDSDGFIMYRVFRKGVFLRIEYRTQREFIELLKNGY